MSDQEAPKPVDVHVGERLRQRRRQLRVTQAFVAQALNLAPQQVQKYERGVNRISASTLHALAQVLEVPISYFFDGLPASVEPGRSALARWGPTSAEGAEFAAVLESIRRPSVRERLLGLARDIAAEERSRRASPCAG